MGVGLGVAVGLGVGVGVGLGVAVGRGAGVGVGGGVGVGAGVGVGVGTGVGVGVGLGVAVGAGVGVGVAVGTGTATGSDSGLVASMGRVEITVVGGTEMGAVGAATPGLPPACTIDHSSPTAITVPTNPNINFLRLFRKPSGDAAGAGGVGPSSQSTVKSEG